MCVCSVELFISCVHPSATNTAQSDFDLGALGGTRLVSMGYAGVAYFLRGHIGSKYMVYIAICKRCVGVGILSRGASQQPYPQLPKVLS